MFRADAYVIRLATEKDAADLHASPRSTPRTR